MEKCSRRANNIIASRRERFLAWRPCEPARAFETKRLLNNVSRGARPWNCILSFSASARKIARLFFLSFLFSFTSNPTVSVALRSPIFLVHRRSPFSWLFYDIHSYRQRAAILTAGRKTGLTRSTWDVIAQWTFPRASHFHAGMLMLLLVAN